MRFVLLSCIGVVAAIAICNLFLYTYDIRNITLEPKSDRVVPSFSDDHIILSADHHAAPSADALAVPPAENITVSLPLADGRPTNLSQHDGRPHMIFHVGPIKTGSSTIQCSMPHYQEALERDNYFFIGKVSSKYCKEDYPPNKFLRMKPIHFYLKHSKRTSAGNLTEYWLNFTNVLEEHRTQGHDVILSDEVMFLFKMETPFISPLLDALSQWQVKIVIVYRRYYEWLPSAHNQFNKVVCSTPEKCQWGSKKPSVTFDVFMKKLRTWEIRDHYLNPVAFLQKGFGAFFKNVHIVNIHTIDDLFTHFVCQILSGANETCATRMDEDLSKATTVENPSVPVHYDMLTRAAFRNRMVNNKRNKRKVRDDVVRYSQEHMLSFSDFPIRCISSQQEERLLNRSLYIEKELYPDWFASPEGETQHRAGFADALEKKKFCSIDTKAALKDKKWQDFFSSYRSGSNM